MQSPRTTAIWCQPRGWTCECSCSVCSQGTRKTQQLSFFLLSPMPLGLRVGMKVSLYCVMHHRWESQSLLPPCWGAHLLCIGWEVYQENCGVSGSSLLMVFFFPSRTAVVNFSVFAVIFVQVSFSFFLWEKNWGWVWGAEKTHTFACRGHFHFWILAWKLGLNLLLACCLNMVQW